MRGIRGKWLWRTGESVAPRSAEAPAGGTLVERVLTARGLTDSATCRDFLDPKLTHLHDPSAMADLDRAAERLLAAGAAGDPIVIYGDYDVDGITATAILYHTLKAVRPGADVRTYVPHRLDEGYGLNSGAIEDLAAAGARVIVSVDCGVTAVEPARVARERGLDLIITDHHQTPERAADLPDAYAIVHPRRPGAGEYPFGDLCGAGVAYKLAWRLATMAAGSQRVGRDLQSLLVELLAFASLGVIADVVPLVGENRVIARYGLGRVRTSPFIGLRALVEASGLTGEKVNAMDVGFKLAPRLNACGRMGHAREAVELFTTADEPRAAQIAAELTRQNDQRRSVEREIFEQAADMAVASGMTGPDRRAIVLADDRWHAGVVGIVCSRLVEKFGRPAILLCRKDGSCHGSGRSIDGFDLHAALAACAGMLDRFGGHTMAAGLHVAESNLDRFVEAFIDRANDLIGEDDLVPRIRVDCEAALSEFTLDEVQSLDKLAPFGRGNPEVRVLVRGLTLAAPPQMLGTGGKHLALSVRGPRGPMDRIAPLMRLVGWSWGEGPHVDRLRTGTTLDAVIEPTLNNWNGRVNVEGQVRDLSLAASTTPVVV